MGKWVFSFACDRCVWFIRFARKWPTYSVILYISQNMFQSFEIRFLKLFCAMIWYISICGRLAGINTVLSVTFSGFSRILSLSGTWDLIRVTSSFPRAVKVSGGQISVSNVQLWFRLGGKQFEFDIWN